jgi:hypothetical protein
MEEERGGGRRGGEGRRRQEKEGRRRRRKEEEGRGEEKERAALKLHFLEESKERQPQANPSPSPLNPREGRYKHDKQKGKKPS